MIDVVATDTLQIEIIADEIVARLKIQKWVIVRV